MWCGASVVTSQYRDLSSTISRMSHFGELERRKGFILNNEKTFFGAALMSRHGSVCGSRMPLYITWLTTWKGKMVDNCFHCVFDPVNETNDVSSQKYEALRMHWYPAYQPLLYVWKNRRQPNTCCIFGLFASHNFTCTHLRGPGLNWGTAWI